MAGGGVGATACLVGGALVSSRGVVVAAATAIYACAMCGGMHGIRAPDMCIDMCMNGKDL